MPACPVCGKDNPDGFRFCGFCAAALDEPEASTVREERRVVSILFCDLVGFTAASEHADPEDVRAGMHAYYRRLRPVIESFGGRVEKYIGDAILAVFGVPLAHEDDAERAVRAGLAIVGAIDDLNATRTGPALAVRIGINTGEVLVALGATAEGESEVLGDAVNTAARIQAAAPVNGVVVGISTYEATERVFEYDELPPVEAKGKSEPVEVWRAVAPRARLGSDVTRAHTTPLVGRARERSRLIEVFDQSVELRSCRLVTVVGEPGIGKSRLCRELLAHVEQRPGLVRWRQGRCLPYGDRIAYWALGEIVKAEAGILESDPPEVAAEKLEGVLPRDDPDLAWLRARLQPLVGAGGQAASHEESFAAWRRVIESWASARETVLVFEDLHWADESLLAFLEYLAGFASGVPLLLLCTTRPELRDEHPTWTSELPNAATIDLHPLTDDEASALVSTLLLRSPLSSGMQQAVLERAGGNPLYAEEFVRLVADRGVLPDRLDVPDSLQALIAARLDLLSPRQKGLLLDASVVGKVFWAGALVEMGERDTAEVDAELEELVRKELVRRDRVSSMQDEVEYAFWHVLVRDVCYGQIPRAARAARHRAAAAWIEAKAGERAEDLADVLAHHYVAALELSRATGGDGADELAAGALRFLGLAAERALALDVSRAEASLARALELAPPGHPDRPYLLERWGFAALQQNRLPEARTALEEALAIARGRNDPVGRGRVLTTLAGVLWRLGDVAGQRVILEAVEVLEAAPPGPELVEALVRWASLRATNAAYPEAVELAGRAHELAMSLGLPPPPAALGTRGLALSALGDRRAVADIRQSLEVSLAQGQSRIAASNYANLALVVWLYDGPEQSLSVALEGIEFSRRRGITELADHLAGGIAPILADIGSTEEALTAATEAADRQRAAGSINFAHPRSLQVRLQTERGEHVPREALDELITAARDTAEPQTIAFAFAAAARVHLCAGRLAEARALLVELDPLDGARADPVYAGVLPDLVRTALALGDASLAERLVDGVEPVTPLADNALAASRAQLAEVLDPAEAARLHAQAAERWRAFGNRSELAFASLGRGRCLQALGDPGAGEPLAEARELFSSMSYRLLLGEVEELLSAAAGTTVG